MFLLVTDSNVVDLMCKRDEMYLSRDDIGAAVSALTLMDTRYGIALVPLVTQPIVGFDIVTNFAPQDSKYPVVLVHDDGTEEELKRYIEIEVLPSRTFKNLRHCTGLLLRENLTKVVGASSGCFAWSEIIRFERLQKSLTNPFHCDKESTLQIFKEIVVSVAHENAISLHRNMNRADWYYDNYPDRIVSFRHRCAIIEASVSGNQGDPLNAQDLLDSLQRGNYSRSADIEIFNGSEIVDGEIGLEGYFHGTDYEHDEVSVRFSHNEKTGCWIMCEDGGIGPNGCVTILDFSEYYLPFIYPCQK